MVELRRLQAEDMVLVAELDRSEHIDRSYRVEGGRLLFDAVDWDVPGWFTDRQGDHSLANLIETWQPIVAEGAEFFGAFENAAVLGVMIVDPRFQPEVAWLAFLHVGRSHRRRGVAGKLWDRAEHLATAAGALSLYVSATSSGSAVGFYLSRGCELAVEPHPALFAKEPEDIHLLKQLG
jgi:ribosomal protein S18 acetylase RimI-like enzyme